MEGTATKTPADLEEAIGLLGANINFSSSNEDFRVSGSCLVKNLNETLKLVHEMLTEPRWDQKEFDRLKLALATSLKGREANPNAIASLNYAKLLYGDNHIFSIPSSGTTESTNNITMDDLKDYFNKLSPEKATIHVAGAVTGNQATESFGVFKDLKGGDFVAPEYALPQNPVANTLYFIDVPDSKQSVLYIGKLALSSLDPDYDKLNFANEVLGSGSSGKLTQTLRIEKGYTYGAYSGLASGEEVAPFYIITSVRANATLASLEIIKNMVANYETDFTEKELEITKNKILKDNTRAYESLGAKLGILRSISKYNKPVDYIEKEQELLVNMTLDDYHNVINKYLKEEDMIYIVVGDKETQLQEVEKLGKPIVELDIHGNKL